MGDSTMPEHRDRAVSRSRPAPGSKPTWSPGLARRASAVPTVGRPRRSRPAASSSESCSTGAGPGSPIRRSTAAAVLPAPTSGRSGRKHSATSCPTSEGPGTSCSGPSAGPCSPMPVPRSCTGTSPKLLSGEELWCQFYSEPEAGSDLAGIRTSAIRDGDRWILRGSKIWSTGAEPRRLRHVPGPDRLERAQAPGPDVVRGTHERRAGSPSGPSCRSTGRPGSARSSSTTSR